MRDTFIKILTEEAAINKKIILMVGDLGYSVIEDFQEKFPDRFYNAGISEQNMASMAAGLASDGFHVFIYSIANFPYTS
jgi:transketolase